jgi:lysophospholipase L1-like esterase
LKPLRYLALGDSYTIGTGASHETSSWPSILARRLEEASGRQIELTNPAVNGFTTLDLIEHELPYLERLEPQLVTILIGVNDLVRGRNETFYLGTLTQIYEAVAALGLPQGQVAGISIPDWWYTPAAAEYGGADRVKRLTKSFNEVAEKTALGHAFKWVDIGNASTAKIGTPGWIAADELHPGDIQYAAWADAIWESIGDSWTAAARS